MFLLRKKDEATTTKKRSTWYNAAPTDDLKYDSLTSITASRNDQLSEQTQQQMITKRILHPLLETNLQHKH